MGPIVLCMQTYQNDRLENVVFFVTDAQHALSNHIEYFLLTSLFKFILIKKTVQRKLRVLIY